jgi:hypothetical protein
MILIVSYETDISVENLTHLEDSGRFSILTPEIFRDLRNCVNSDAIEIEFCDNF